VLTVTDAAGCTDTASVTVNVIPLPIITVSANPSSFCLGDSSRLVASSSNNPYQAVSYVWSPTSGLSSGTGASVWAKPTVSGPVSYTVTGTSSFGCTSSASVTLTVWALPSVNAGPDSTVCNQNVPVILVGTPPGGTWSGPGVSNGQFTPTTPGVGVGTWSLIYSYTDANGCRNSDTARYTVVNPTPAVAGVDDTLCLNSPPITLQGSPANGSWSGTGITPNGTFTPSTVGVFPLVYTYGSGSCLSRDTLLMTVLPLPSLNLSPNDTICIGDTIALSVSSNNVPNQATTFVWSPTTGLSAGTGPNVLAFPLVNTTYTVTGNSTFGCSSSASVSVRVNPLPVVDVGPNQSFCDTNLIVQLNPVTAGGGVWSGSNITPGGALNLGPLTPGIYPYLYTFTDSNGCINRDSLQVTISSPTLAVAGPDDSLCVNAAAIALSGQPTGGTWTGSVGIVNNNSFSPVLAGPGTFTLVYTSGTGTCQSRDSLSVLVYALPIVDAGNPRSFCIDGGLQQLNGSPAGGNWSGLGVNPSGVFDPLIAGISSNYLYYTFSDGNNCSNVDSVLITVNPLPFVDAGNDTSFCLQPILAQLGGSSNPAGGTWSGTGIVNAATGAFDPTLSGTGVFWVYYTVTSGAGCDAIDSLRVTVSSPNTVFAGNDTAVCINSGTFQLNPNPGGGTWSGQGVSTTGVVTPSSSGSFLLIYSFGTGTCLRTDTLVLTVHPLPTINLAGNIQSICVDRPSVLLSALPGGGVWTGSGITGNSFDPGTAGPGLHWLVYTYTDANTCTNLDSIAITVNALPTVFAGNDTTLCDLPVPVGFTGNYNNSGTWSGTGVSANGVFTPAGVGTYNLVYSYTDGNGCSSSDTLVVTVVSPQTADAGPGDTVCVDAPPFTLSGFFPSAGGTWSGPGIVNASTGLFDPALAFQGLSVTTPFTLYYSYGQGNCYTIDSTLVTVHPLPVVQAGNDIDTCISVAAFNLGGYSPAGGSWSGPGIVNAAAGTIDPAIAGVGIHPLVYSYTSPLTGCINRDSIRFEVFPLPVPDFSIDSILCINVAYSPLNNSTGGFSWFWDFGNGITSVLQSPQITYAATGTYSIVLVVTSAEGCVDSVRQTVQVVEPPSPSFTLAPDEGCGPLTVTFNNTSTSFSPAYTWDFGNGQSSTDEDPAPVTYIASLYNDTTYYITLSVGNLCGSVNAVDSVLVHPSPTSYFGVNVNSGCSPLTIDFSNNSYGLPTSYFWDFGDGTFSTDSLPPPHVYTTDSTISTYVITLIAYNACGSDTLRDTITVLPNTVRAFFNTSPLSGCAPLTVTFTNFSQGATTYTWNFGDGNVSNQFSVVHVYASPGSYQVSMEAHNGCSYDTAYQTITVWPLPVAGFSLTQDTVCVGDVITVTNTSTSVISGISWDFGDGTTSTLNPASHTYTQSGTYTVSQVLSTSLGCTDTFRRTVYVRQPPLVNAGNDTLFCYQFIPAQLNPFASPAGGVWSGAGITNSLTGSFDPVAAGIGLHPVLYTFTDGFGCPNSDTVLVTVTPPPTVDAGNDTAVCLNSIPFVLVGTGTPPGLPYSWSGALVQAGGLLTPSQVGSFLMTFQYGSGTCAVEDYLSVTVNPLPSINLSGNDSVFCLNESVWNLIASPVGGIWSGPGVVGNSFDPALSGAGLFQLNYSFTDANGCTNNQTLNIRVNPLPPVWAGNDTTVCNQAIPVQLNGNFSNQGIWTGPGVSINGSFTPPGTGTYQAIYTYEDALGCSTSDTLDITVVPPVFADAGPGLSACVDSGTFVLPGFSPASGGFWSGPGIINASLGLF
ncbi:MAG: PKD domain-containing protein, partial [Bacteroidota bacterium]